MTDVDFSLSTIDALNADRTRFERVDFRNALDVGFAALTSLKGSLFAPEQIPALAYTFATALEAGIEREPDDDEHDPV